MKRYAAAMCMILLSLPAEAADAIPVPPAAPPGATAPAAPPAPVPQAPADAGDDSFLTSGNAAAIGVGAVAGVALLSGVFCVPPAVSAVAGGAAGHWWYRQYEAEQAAGLNYRRPSHFAITYDGNNPASQMRWLGAPSEKRI